MGLDEEEEEWEVDEEDEWTLARKVPELNCSVVYNVQESVVCSQPRLKIVITFQVYIYFYVCMEYRMIILDGELLSRPQPRQKVWSQRKHKQNEKCLVSGNFFVVLLQI